MSEELTHFGVKGMKWGQRKSESSGGSDSDAAFKKKRNQARVKKALLIGGGVAAAAAVAYVGKQRFNNAQLTKAFVAPAANVVKGVSLPPINKVSLPSANSPAVSAGKAALNSVMSTPKVKIPPRAVPRPAGNPFAHLKDTAPEAYEMMKMLNPDLLK